MTRCEQPEAADLDEHVAAITQVGALRAGLAVYQDFFVSAKQVEGDARTPLTIPVRAFGGASCLGPLTLTSAQAVAPKAEGGVIERCGQRGRRGARRLRGRPRASAGEGEGVRPVSPRRRRRD